MEKAEKWYENRMVKNLIWAFGAVAVASLPIDIKFKAGLVTLFVSKVETSRKG